MMQLSEPVIHSHIDDLLPDEHPLQLDSIGCMACLEMVHAANNECMQTWIEWGDIVICMSCWVKYMAGGDDEFRASVLDHDNYDCLMKWIAKQKEAIT